MLPTLVGENVSAVVQDVAVASVPLQVLAPMAYCVPVVKETLEKVIVDPLLLVNVTVWLELVLFTKMFPKASETGETATGAVPVPESDTVSGLFGSLLTITKDAVSRPTMDGVNVTVIVHPVPGGIDRLFVHVGEEVAKSAALGPEMVTAFDDAKIRFAVPTLETVTGTVGEAVTPTTTLPKGIDEGERFAAATVATMVAEVCIELALVPAVLKAFTT